MASGAGGQHTRQSQNNPASSARHATLSVPPSFSNITSPQRQEFGAPRNTVILPPLKDVVSPDLLGSVVRRPSHVPTRLDRPSPHEGSASSNTNIDVAPPAAVSSPPYLYPGEATSPQDVPIFYRRVSFDVVRSEHPRRPSSPTLRRNDREGRSTTSDPGIRSPYQSTVDVYTAPAHSEADHFYQSCPNFNPSDSGVQSNYRGVKTFPGRGTYHVYEGGYCIPTHVDGREVNPAWGLTKAYRPRKRLSIACNSCRRKKIRCEPGIDGCLQCKKSNQICRPSEPTQHYPSASYSGPSGSGRAPYVFSPHV